MASTKHRLGMHTLVGLTLCAGQALSAGARADQPTGGGKGMEMGKGATTDGLIPRTVLFGNPDRAAGRVSPDGKFFSYIAPVNGVMNVHVAPVDGAKGVLLDQARAVTSDTKRGIRSYFWAYDGKHLLYVQDVGGDENWKVYAADVTGKDVQVRDLTPFEDIKGPDGKPIMLPSGQPMRPAARVLGVSDKVPGRILVGLNNRDPRFHNAYSLDLATGKMELVFRNDRFQSVDFDDHFRLRHASSMNEKGGTEYVTNARAMTPAAEPEWKPWFTVAMEDEMTTSPIGYSDDGQTAYLLDSRGRNTGALFAQDLATGKQSLLAEHPKADAGGVLSDPKTSAPQAVQFDYLRAEWTLLDKSLQGDVDYLKTVADGEWNVTSRTLDDRLWTVAFLVDNGPARTYFYDRAAKKATLLYVNNARLDGQPLVKMHPVVIKARDGMELVSYLTLPPGADADGDGKPERASPLVLNVHGGPWARDNWGFDPEAQWLANRGYAVLQVNFRGSTGFGKAHVNAGNREWAAKMHDDLLDARQWAIDQGVAEAKKTAVYGGSYGGYAALVAATFTPDVFACNVSVVGPSNINTLLSTIPPYWEPGLAMFAARVGDHRSEEGRKFLESRSPLSLVGKITRPLLIGQGANDPRVKQAESDQIVKAMNDKGIPVTYVLFPDEGHGFARPPNRLAFYAVAEAFLAQHLGGRVQPIGEDFNGSTVLVPSGADAVPGVSEAINNKK